MYICIYQCISCEMLEFINFYWFIFGCFVDVGLFIECFCWVDLSIYVVQNVLRQDCFGCSFWCVRSNLVNKQWDIDVCWVGGDIGCIVVEIVMICSDYCFMFIKWCVKIGEIVVDYIFC